MERVQELGVQRGQEDKKTGMAIQKFEDMIAWQKAQDLAFDIYQGFGDCRDYGFKDQLFRAAVSVSNNLAEGFERGSRIDFK